MKKKFGGFFVNLIKHSPPLTLDVDEKFTFFGIWVWDEPKDFQLIFNVEKYLYNSVHNLDSFINNCNSFLDKSHAVMNGVD